MVLCLLVLGLGCGLIGEFQFIVAFGLWFVCVVLYIVSVRLLLGFGFGI